MVFSSSYFVFLFLPLAIIVCFSCPSRFYLLAVFVVSTFFYFWSAGIHALILIGIIVANWAGALTLEQCQSRALYATLIVGNIGVLLVFKYAGFLSANYDFVAGTDLYRSLGGIMLPAGVSFFVFQAISYLTDVSRREITAEKSLVRYGSYQSFFPHLIAGPIVRFKDVIDDFRDPKLSIENFSYGITRFAHGLCKKTVIADGVAPIANSVFALPVDQVDFATVWMGATAYGIQIYFDFSGYSDMAIGMAQMFGIRFHENFARPYASRSITEFWRRWHISLSSWFRDYVYIPLGGSRGSSLMTYRNLLFVFAVTGFWHGAAWTFVIWGLFHGAFLILERITFRSPVDALSHPALRWLYCLPVVIFAWVVFRASTLSQALGLWRAMLSPLSCQPFDVVALRAALTPYSVAALAVGGLIYFLPGRVSLGLRLTSEPKLRPLRIANVAYTAAALITAALLILTGSFSPFLYFTF